MKIISRQGALKLWEILARDLKRLKINKNKLQDQKIHKVYKVYKHTKIIVIIYNLL